MSSHPLPGEGGKITKILNKSLSFALIFRMFLHITKCSKKKFITCE